MTWAAKSVSQNQKVGAGGTAVEPLQLATLTAKRQRREAKQSHCAMQ
jgi:hypothetical protein